VPTAEEIRSNVLELYRRAYDAGDYEPTKNFLSPAFACSNPTYPMSGFEEIRTGIEMQRAAFADLKMEITHCFPSDDAVSIVWTMSGRHVKAIYGVEASGRNFTASGISIHELSDGHSIGAHSCTNIVTVLQEAHLHPKP
jgi:predicted ester cyclase